MRRRSAAGQPSWAERPTSRRLAVGQRDPREGSGVGCVKRGIIDCKLQPRVAFDDGVGIALQLGAVAEDVYASAAVVLRQQVFRHQELKFWLHVIVQVQARVKERDCLQCRRVGYGCFAEERLKEGDRQHSIIGISIRRVAPWPRHGRRLIEVFYQNGQEI